MSGTAAEVDGRRLRRQQNREAVLEALASMFSEGDYTPSSADIAERAGLSPRSLFRYFDDVDDLNRAAIERQQATALPLVDPGVGPLEPTADKIRAVAEARVRLFEAIAPSARAARVAAHRHPLVRAQISRSRSYLRRQLRRLFAPELEAVDGDVLPALDALCSFETYDLLRVDQGLSRIGTVAALRGALTALLQTTADVQPRPASR